MTPTHTREYSPFPGRSESSRRRRADLDNGPYLLPPRLNLSLLDTPQNSPLAPSAALARTAAIVATTATVPRTAQESSYSCS